MRPDKHYAIQPLDRVNVDEFLDLIRAERYFAVGNPETTMRENLTFQPIRDRETDHASHAAARGRVATVLAASPGQPAPWQWTVRTVDARHVAGGFDDSEAAAQTTASFYIPDPRDRASGAGGAWRGRRLHRRRRTPVRARAAVRRRAMTDLEPRAGRPLATLSDMDQARIARLTGALAPASVASYGWGWRLWAAFAEDEGHTALPAEPEPLAQFVDALAGQGYKPASIHAALAAVGAAHRYSGTTNPARSEDVRAAVKRAVREHRDAGGSVR